MGGFTLNNVTTSDGYTTDNTVIGVPLDNYILTVSGGSIYYQLGVGGNFNTPEQFVAPGYHARSRPQYDSLRVRSAVAGVPAQVTLERGAK